MGLGHWQGYRSTYTSALAEWKANDGEPSEDKCQYYPNTHLAIYPQPGVDDIRGGESSWSRLRAGDVHADVSVSNKSASDSWSGAGANIQHVLARPVARLYARHVCRRLLGRILQQSVSVYETQYAASVDCADRAACSACTFPGPSRSSDRDVARMGLGGPWACEFAAPPLPIHVYDSCEGTAHG